MNKLYKTSLFIFRRDLRLPDNTGLLQAMKQSERVIPIFIVDPIQVGATNKYRSANAIQYMIESLQDLEREIKKKGGKLYVFYGNTLTIMKKLITQIPFDALFLNYDYTPFARKRDEALEKLCAHRKRAFHGFHDELLIGDPDELMSGTKKPYAIFTPFYKKAAAYRVAKPVKRIGSSWYKAAIAGSNTLKTIALKALKKKNPSLVVSGGRSAALRILRSLKRYKNYAKERDFPALDATTHLSAAHKFNVISIRESYHAMVKQLGRRHPLIRQLYWRDFYTYIAFHYPHVFGKPYYKKYEKLRWSTSKKAFAKWCTGTTGFPIVDAGMRQLNTTGWMHNRVRMIVGSFLVKDLHLNWQWGERYFAQQLVDYDPAVNNGNWQWCASTGSDAQPYFRIFNPWLQQKRFDPKCAYIKQWIPELKDIPAKEIHAWFKNSTKLKTYPQPMVDHAKEKERAYRQYKQAQR